MSLPEQGTKVATGIVENMKQQPVCLALLVICAGLVGFVFYSEHNQTETRKILFDRILDEQHSVQELLTRCDTPPKG